MNKEELFELIRGEEVVLWAGAGMSLYAGYPLGQGTAEFLYQSFPEEFKGELDIRKPLPQFVEDYVNLQNGNLNKVIRILNKLFLANPISKKYHDILATIPHIKNIITTNYDRLFELSYGSDKMHTILSSNNLAYLDKNKINLFKIHGDLQNPDSIIIAAKDYRAYFIEKQEQILWKYIETMLATKPVVFIGYTLDDINILSMYEKLMNSFKNHMPQAFLVSPYVSRAKENELRRNNITHIPLTGEDFVQELLQNIKDNIINDVETGKTSADTFHKFMKHHNLQASLSSNSDGFNVSNLTKQNGEAEGSISITGSNKELFNALNRLKEGPGHEAVTLSADDLKGVEFRIEDLKMPFDKGGEYRLVLSPIALRESLCDFTFDDFELHGVECKIFKIVNGLQIVVYIHTAIFELSINMEKAKEDSSTITTKFNLTNNLSDKNIKSSTKEQIDIYSFIKAIGTGNSFKVFIHKGNSLQKITPAAAFSIDVDKYLDYFHMLKRIEKEFDVRFTQFSNINEYVDDVIMLDKAIRGASEEVIWDGEVSLTDTYGKGKEAEDAINKIKNGDGGDIKLEEIGSLKFEIHNEIIKINRVRSFKFLRPIVGPCKSGSGICIRSENNSFMVTHSYSLYNEE